MVCRAEQGWDRSGRGFRLPYHQNSWGVSAVSDSTSKTKLHTRRNMMVIDVCLFTENFWCYVKFSLNHRSWSGDHLQATLAPWTIKIFGLFAVSPLVSTSRYYPPAGMKTPAGIYDLGPQPRPTSKSRLRHQSREPLNLSGRRPNLLQLVADYVTISKGNWSVAALNRVM